MPRQTVGEAFPPRGTWVFCVLNVDGAYNNIFFEPNEAEVIVVWVRKLRLLRTEFHNPQFWSEMGAGNCRVGKVYKVIPATAKSGRKLNLSYPKFKAESTRRCIGRCESGDQCLQVFDPLTGRLVQCRCPKH
jgi:hypothetical protein